MARSRIELATILEDPFGTLRRARETGWLADIDTDFVSALSYEGVRELLTDPRLHANFVDFMHGFGVNSGTFHDWMALSPLNLDGAEHQRWRALMSRTFTPRSVERLRPFLQQAAHELIDGFAARGRCEFTGEFADIYPSLGLCELIGVPQEDRSRFRGWANTVGLGFSPVQMAARIGEIDEALTQLLAYTGDLAARRRVEPRDDLVTRIAQAAESDGWTDDSVRAAIAGLVFAGHETTKNQLGWMVVVLADHPDMWDGVAHGSIAAADIVEEVLRYRSAVSAVGRTAAETVTFGNEELPAGTRVLISVWSANHDHSAFPQADAVTQANATTPHVAFGHGPHHCLGAALARAELQEALTALAQRLCGIVLEEGAQWKPPVGINGPDRLPLRFARRTGT